MGSRTALGLGILLAGAVALPATAGTSAPPLPPLPQYPCAGGVNDDKGDAAPQYLGSTTSSVIQNNPALDIRAVDVHLTADQLQVFMAIDGVIDPSSMAAYEASYRYTVTFKFSGKTFTYGIEQQNPSNPAQPLDGTSYPMMTMGTSGNDLAGSTAAIKPGDAKSPSWVVFTSPRDKVEKVVGPIADGATFTDIYALTQVWTSQEKALADDITVTGAKATYVVGQDPCFGPPATSITSLTAPSAQWSDSSALSAVLLDATGAPLAGKQVSFTVADGKGTTLTAMTDSAGRATASYAHISVKAGNYPVTAQFAGDATGGASQASGTLTVSAEKTVFKPLQIARPSATTRTVTATLLDDDKTPVAGVVVDWWVNGKKVSHGKTDSRGKVVLRNVKPGQTVQARYVGSAGTLLAASSKAVKA